MTLLTALTVTRLRGVAAPDGYGGTVVDWSTPAELDVQAWFAETDSADIADGVRIALTTSAVLELPPEVNVEATDRWRVNGEVYEIDGKPKVAFTPRGIHHRTLRLRLVEG